MLSWRYCDIRPKCLPPSELIVASRWSSPVFFFLTSHISETFPFGKDWHVVIALFFALFNNNRRDRGAKVVINFLLEFFSGLMYTFKLMNTHELREKKREFTNISLDSKFFLICINIFKHWKWHFPSVSKL